MPIIRGTAKWIEPRPSGTLYVQDALFIEAGDVGTAVSDVTHECLLSFRKEFGRLPVFSRMLVEIRIDDEQVNAVLFEYPEHFQLDPDADR